MTPARAPRPSAKKIVINTPNLRVRTLTTDDASDRVAAWFSQADVRSALNLPEQNKTKADIIEYIKRFDQSSNLLLGIFDKAKNFLVGLLTVEIDWRIGRYVANTVVGEEAYRSKGVMLEITLPFRDYFFETMGLKVLAATALATNIPIIAYFVKTGWTLNQTVKGHTKSHDGGTMIDLHLYSITREAWRAWKAANPEIVKAMAQGTLRSS
jgi:RimJ/RimL family protein N-acetyltransferase